MPKPVRAPAGVGHNEGALADHNTIRYCLAHQILLKEKQDKLKEEIKRARKGFEKKGVSLSDLDEIVKDRDEPESTLIQKLKRKVHYAGALMRRTFQLDLFSGDPDTIAVIHQKGMMAGIEGKTADAPPTYDNAERNAWLEGHNEGADARAEVLQDMENEALAADGGEAVDGTRGAIKNRAAAKVADKAKLDFDADNPGVVAMPDWTGFGEDPETWTDDQHLTFNAWFDALPDESGSEAPTRYTLPPAVGLAFAQRRDAKAQAIKEGGFTEAKPAELEKQVGREVVKANRASKAKESQSQKASRLAAEAGTVA